MVPPIDPVETLRRFEARAPEPFNMAHAEHVAVAWCYLQTMPLLDGLETMIREIRAFSESRGVPERYKVFVLPDRGFPPPSGPTSE